MPEQKNNSQEYWNKRARQDKIKVIKTAEFGVDNLKKLLKKNLDSVEKQIKEFYKKYGEEGKYAESLSYAEFQKYKAKLRLKAKQNPQDKTLQRLAKQDIPKYRIDRLRALQTDLQIQLTEATRGQEAGIYKTLKDVAKVSQATTALRFKKTLDVAFDKIASRKMEKILSSDWVGNMNWSERLWKDRELVGKKVTEILEEGIPQGKSMQDMARDLKEATNSSFNDAFRLIRTESAHVDGEVTLEGFKQAKRELGYTKYIFDATIDNRTSEICAEKDNKSYYIDEAVIGENFPPLHPNCRSTAVLDESSIDESVIEDSKQEEKEEETPEKEQEKQQEKEEVTEDNIKDKLAESEKYNKDLDKLIKQEKEKTKILEQEIADARKTYSEYRRKWIFDQDLKAKAEADRINEIIKAKGKEINSQNEVLAQKIFNSLNNEKNNIVVKCPRGMDDIKESLQNIINKIVNKEIITDEVISLTRRLDTIDETGKRIVARSAFRASDNTISLSETVINNNDTAIALHEAMHWLEHNNKKILNKSIAFLEYRTKGEPEKLLSELTQLNYGPLERAKKDKFYSPYCGKIYRDRNGYNATEILSMGIESIYNDPLFLYEKDREYFNFVIGVLRNNL